MKSLLSLTARARALLDEQPGWKALFPSEPWGEEELAEIANTVENFMLVENVMDDDPWVDWLDRWKFYQSLK